MLTTSWNWETSCAKLVLSSNNTSGVDIDELTSGHWEKLAMRCDAIQHPWTLSSGHCALAQHHQLCPGLRTRKLKETTTTTWRESLFHHLPAKGS